MANLLETITLIFAGSGTGAERVGGIVDWVQTVVTMITDNPLILLFVVMAVALIAVGVVRRLIRL